MIPIIRVTPANIPVRCDEMINTLLLPDLPCPTRYMRPSEPNLEFPATHSFVMKFAGRSSMWLVSAQIAARDTYIAGFHPSPINQYSHSFQVASATALPT